MERKSESSNKFIFIGILVILSMIIFIFSFSLRDARVLNEQRVPISYELGDKSGFDADKTSLTLGRVGPGTSNTRAINLDNSYNFSIFVIVSFEGNVYSPFLSYPKKIDLGINESKQLGFTVAMPGNSEERGNYSGWVVIKSYRA